MIRSQTGKDAGIETLRGLAVVLMVCGHVVGVDGESGLRVSDDSGWRYLYYTLAPLRMPLFTGISGFVYGLRPATGGGWSGFILGKLRRLIIPLVVVGSVYITVQMLVPETGTQLGLRDIPRSLVIPYAHFWYLHALAWVFLVVGSLDALGLLQRRWQILTLLAVALVLRATGPLATPVLGIWHAQYLLPYFIVGLGVQRVPLQRGRAHAMALLGLGAVGMALYQSHWFGLHWASDMERYAVSTLIGAVGISGLLHYRVRWRPLAALGSFSYGIYLLHVFGTAGARIMLQRAGIGSLFVLALAGLVAGIGLPIVVERAIERRPWLVLLVLGRSRTVDTSSSAASQRLAA